jgi:hypothetical protein
LQAFRAAATPRARSRRPTRGLRPQPHPAARPSRPTTAPA